MKNFDRWMHRYFSIELKDTQAQAIDDWAGAVGFTFQEQAGVITVSVLGFVLGLFLIAAIL